MALRHIEAFRAVMLAGSMTEAARRMHTSQPQVSRLISQLESITQFLLFHRSGSRLAPTVDGLRFYQSVEKTFAGLAELESAAFSAGRLSVAAMPRLAAGLLARIVARFKADHPDVMVTIHSGNETMVNDWIVSGFCDMGLAMLYGDAPGVQVEQVHSAPCVAIMPRGHGLASKRRLSPMDFDGEPFISFPAGSPVRAQIDGIFQQAGASRVIVAEAGLGASICALVGAGLGLSVINPLAASEEREKSGIEIRPFGKRMMMSIALLFPPYKARTRLVAAFAACAREVLRKELNERRG